MPQGLFFYCRKYLGGGEALARVQCPVLLWETPPARTPDDGSTTVGGTSSDRSMSGEPLVLELHKCGECSTGGITVGRVKSNCVVIPEESVSRFHACFEPVASPGQWKLTDLESRNGTRVAGQRLQPNKPQPVPDGAPVRFGKVELVFLLPDAFLARVREAAKEFAPPPPAEAAAK